MVSRKTTIGVMAGIAMGALWGFEFLVPQMLSAFSPLQIITGRYFFFGLISLAGVVPAYRIFKSLAWPEKATVFCLSASGFWLYTLLLVIAVQLNGGVMTTLILGAIPVLIPVVEKRGRHMHRALWAGLFLITAGICALHLLPLLHSGIETNAEISWPGLAAALACPVLWTWFALQNGQFLRKHPEIPRVHMTNMIGIYSFISAMVIASLAGYTPATILQHSDFAIFAFWTALLGLGSSWLANLFWNICSSHCPPAISGPLIVSETLFGLFYTFIYQSRLPDLHEVTAMVLLCSGVILALYAESDKEA